MHGETVKLTISYQQPKSYSNKIKIGSQSANVSDS